MSHLNLRFIWPSPRSLGRGVSLPFHLALRARSNHKLVGASAAARGQFVHRSCARADPRRLEASDGPSRVLTPPDGDGAAVAIECENNITEKSTRIFEIAEDQDSVFLLPTHARSRAGVTCNLRPSSLTHSDPNWPHAQTVLFLPLFVAVGGGGRVKSPLR